MRKGTLSDKSVILSCPIYQPVPMKYVSRVLKPKSELSHKSELKGIKHVPNALPPRPIDMNSLAVALATLSDKPVRETRAAVLNNLPEDRSMFSPVQTPRRAGSISSAAPVAPSEQASGTTDIRTFFTRRSTRPSNPPNRLITNEEL